MLAPGTTLGRYRILAPLGAGGMGEVFRARDESLDRDVAVKILLGGRGLDPAHRARFEREARAAGALQHPNVCVVHDVGAHEGIPYVVMELLEGGTLRALLGRGPLPPHRALELVAQAAQGLAAAHEKGIVHRDLKPENLFVTREGRLKVFDFGLARSAPAAPAGGAGPAPTALTESGMVLGTSSYMAPEQVLGHAADARTDLFALGTILHEALAGARPFDRGTAVETMHAILNEDPAPLPATVAPAAAAIVRRCLEKRPEDRFQSASDLAFALRAAAMPAGGAAALPPAAARATPWRPGLGAALAAVGALALVALALFVAQRRAPIAAAYEPLTVQLGRVLGARFGPDGSVLYAAAWGGEPREIYEAHPGTPVSRPLGIRYANLLAVSPSGALAIADSILSYNGLSQWGTLAEVSGAGGAPREILPGVMAADWTADGRTLAVAHRVGGHAQLEMPPGRVIYRTSGQIAVVRVSPDGRRLAIIDSPTPPDPHGTIAILDRDGKVLARTEAWSWPSGVAWSPDGREAWYTATQSVPAELRALSPSGRQRVLARYPTLVALHDVARDGRALMAFGSVPAGIRGSAVPGEPERELGWLDWSYAADLSRDGRTLLFDEEGVGGGPEYVLCTRRMDGSPPVRLGPGGACGLSPDGRWALALRHGPPSRMVLVPTGPGDTLALPRGTVVSHFGGSWLPDGRHVVFVGSDARQVRRTWLQDVSGGPPRPLTPDGIAGSKVSPDGRWVACLDSDQVLYACPVAGGEPRRIARLGPEEKVFQWTADGRALYVGRSDAAFAVDRLAVADGRRGPWRTFRLPDPAGAVIWNIVLTPDGSAYAYSYFRFLDQLCLVTGLR